MQRISASIKKEPSELSVAVADSMYADKTLETRRHWAGADRTDVGRFPNTRDPEFTPRAPAVTRTKVTAHQNGSHTCTWFMYMVVFTLKYMCATMIVDGFQPQTCTGAWCGML